MGGLRSCRCLGRRVNRVDDLRAAGAGEPKLPVVSPAIQVSARLVLSFTSRLLARSTGRARGSPGMVNDPFVGDGRGKGSEPCVSHLPRSRADTVWKPWRQRHKYRREPTSARFSGQTASCRVLPDYRSPRRPTFEEAAIPDHPQPSFHFRPGLFTVVKGDQLRLKH